MLHCPLASNQPRIAVFEPDADLATNPSLTCLLEALTRKGVQVDVFMPSDDARYPTFNSFATRYPFPKPLSLWSGDLRKTLANWWDKGVWRFRVDRVFAEKAYDLIIGVNSLGVIVGCDYAKRFKLPLIYMSFEIFFRDELSSFWEVREKKRECIASRLADLVIIQDQWRAQLLAVENGLATDKFEYLPVSPSGSTKVATSDYLRRRFNLADGQIIVLHAGSFTDWTYAEELLESAAHWPKDFTLVIHTRYKPETTDRYIQKVGAQKLSNVILSTDPLPPDSYEQLVASADMGLVLYKPMPHCRNTQKNIQTIGLSSGKFSYYMKYGIPVISINQRSYEHLLAEYGFGENIASPGEIPEALERVWSNYDHYRKEAQRLFSERLNFDIHWPIIECRIGRLMK